MLSPPSPKSSIRNFPSPRANPQCNYAEPLAGTGGQGPRGLYSFEQPKPYTGSPVLIQTSLYGDDSVPSHGPRSESLPTRILIVDDHAYARSAIRTLLDWHSLQVCGEAQDGKEAIDKVIEMKPEIVLMDINMPGINGVTAASEIRRIAPATKIVFLTVHDAPSFKVGTRSWAHGFVAKSAVGTDLIPTLKRVAGITAIERTIECPHCKVRQTVQVAEQSRGAAQSKQYVSCINCRNEFHLRVPHKIVGGPFTA